MEEELEVVWQAATRENQQMKGALVESGLTADLRAWALSCSTSPDWPHKAPGEITSSMQHQLHSSSPELQRTLAIICDSDYQNNSLDEKHKHGLDFYC